MNSRRSLVAAVIAIACVPAWAGERVARFDPEATEVTFDVGATGHDVHGVLHLTEGVIHVDPATGAASGKITVDARLAETGNKKRDKTMHNKVFESEKYPMFRFVPTRFEGVFADDGKSEIQLHGTLSIHGEDHPMVLPTTVEIADGRFVATTTFPVPYVDWGLNNPSILFLRVAKVVDVTVAAKGTLTDGPAEARQADLGE